MKNNSVIANNKDNVATVCTVIKKGEKIYSEINNKKFELKAVEEIPDFHKIALKDIKQGENVIKYGESIGLATKNIKAGEYVHVHNIESNRGRGDKIVK